MKFIHTSDWHLGRTFHGVQLVEDQAFALDQLEEVVKDEKPDVLLVSGDIYDRSVPPVDAVELLDDFLLRIVRGLGVTVVMIAGNHDSPERLSFASRLLQDQGLHLFGVLSTMAPVIVEDAHGPVRIFGIPYAEPAEVRDAGFGEDVRTHDAAIQVLADKCLAQKSNDRMITLIHAFVAGGKESESERRLSIGGAGEVQGDRLQDFDYIALGHLHRPQKINGKKAQYSGSLLKYSFSEEKDRKGVIVGEMNDKGSVNTKFIEIIPKHDVRRLEGLFKNFEKPTGDRKSREDYLEITLTDRGPVLDAMERLRKFYPNLLNIRRRNLDTDAAIPAKQINIQKVDRMELFSSFFTQVTGEKLTRQEESALSGVLREVEKEQRST